MAKKFTNNEIKLNEIPNFEHIKTKKLEKSYLNIVVINEIIGFIIFAIILGILFYFVEFYISRTHPAPLFDTCRIFFD